MLSGNNWRCPVRNYCIGKELCDYSSSSPCVLAPIIQPTKKPTPFAPKSSGGFTYQQLFTRAKCIDDGTNMQILDSSISIEGCVHSVFAKLTVCQEIFSYDVNGGNCECVLEGSPKCRRVDARSGWGVYRVIILKEAIGNCIHKVQ